MCNYKPIPEVHANILFWSQLITFESFLIAKFEVHLSAKYVRYSFSFVKNLGS